MDKKYIISTQALGDLQDIWSYIAQDNLLYADKVEKELYDEFELLAKNPNIGHLRKDISDKAVRFWSLYSYQIIYKASDNQITIVRILSGYRDIGLILE